MTLTLPYPSFSQEYHSNSMTKLGTQVPTSNEKGLEVYALVDCSRKMQRKLVYVVGCLKSCHNTHGTLLSKALEYQLTLEHQRSRTNRYSTLSTRALSSFPASSKEMKDLPPPHLRDAGGNIFGGHIDEDGKMIPRPGAGALSKMKIGSLMICRTRGSIRVPVVPKRFCLEEMETEEYITKDCLTGLLPQILLQTYRFWRTCCSSVRYSLTLHGIARKSRLESALKYYENTDTNARTH